MSGAKNLVKLVENLPNVSLVYPPLLKTYIKIHELFSIPSQI